MPNDRSIQLDVEIPAQSSFNTQEQPPKNPDQRSEQQLSDQAQNFRELLQPRKESASNKQPSGLFALFSSLSTARELPEQGSEEAASTDAQQPFEPLQGRQQNDSDDDTQRFAEQEPETQESAEKPLLAAHVHTAFAPLLSEAKHASPIQAPQALEQTLHLIVQRLLVSDGSQGRRGVQLELTPEHQPGVVVDIYEESARLVTRFTCSNEDSRAQLNAGANWIAQSLAERLHRDTRVEVQTNNPADPRIQLVEANR